MIYLYDLRGYIEMMLNILSKISQYLGLSVFSKVTNVKVKSDFVKG